MIGTLRSYYVQAWLEGREKEKEEDEWSKYIVLDDMVRAFITSDFTDAWEEGTSMMRELMDKPVEDGRIIQIESWQVRVSLVKPKQEEGEE